MIISGCSAFAHCVGHVRTEAELLPQLWEQVISRHSPWQNVVLFFIDCTRSDVTEMFWSTFTILFAFFA